MVGVKERGTRTRGRGKSRQCGKRTTKCRIWGGRCRKGTKRDGGGGSGKVVEAHSKDRETPWPERRRKRTKRRTICVRSVEGSAPVQCPVVICQGAVRRRWWWGGIRGAICG